MTAQVTMYTTYKSNNRCQPECACWKVAVRSAQICRDLRAALDNK